MWSHIVETAPILAESNTFICPLLFKAYFRLVLTGLNFYLFLWYLHVHLVASFHFQILSIISNTFQELADKSIQNLSK